MLNVSFICSYECCGLEDMFIWFVQCSNLVFYWYFVLQVELWCSKFCVIRWFYFWLTEVVYHIKIMPFLSGYVLVVEFGYWYGSHYGMHRSALCLMHWKMFLGQLVGMLHYLFTLFHLISTLEDVLACVVHWNCLERMCCDVFGSPLSPGVDPNGCYRSR